MPKSADAFRTISEVADWLGVQAHVLRFWESKFAQVKPIKRAGGRRYYRPADMLLLGGIKKLLHDDGLTIKGAQKLLRENGVAFVADLSQPLDDLTMAVIEGSAVPEDLSDDDLIDAHADLDAPAGDLADLPADAPLNAPLDEPPETEIPADLAPDLEADPEAAIPDLEEIAAPEPEPLDLEPPEPEPEPLDLEAEPEPESLDLEPEHTALADTAPDAEAPEADAPPDATPTDAAAEAPDLEDAPAEAALPSFRARPRGDAAPPPPAAEDPPQESTEDAAPAEPDHAPAALDGIAPEVPAFTPSDPPPPPKPRIINLPPIPDASQIDVSPSALSVLGQTKRLSPEQARAIRPLLARLTRLRASMGNPRKEIRKD